MSTETIEQVVKRRFRHLSDQQLIDKANRAPDFGWDDEGCELHRRHEEEGLRYEMDENKLKIIR